MAKSIPIESECFFNDLGLELNGHEGVRYTPHISRTGAWSSDTV